ncbi:intraflagellar transport protein 46 homolog [Haliotis rubra]|uniref:intraflagellar transport protein 46 homolog n=1 Tax=Haliotis rubra TaxID=36100 RepID=UPI001EE63101|nr:intraflagellar transport protein 46 homolog [Haliotis rubra]
MAFQGDLSDEEMDRAAKIHQNQPYDESLDVPDAEEIASTYSPTPRVPNPAARSKQALGLSAPKSNIQKSDRGHSRGDSPPTSNLSEEDDDEEEDDFIEPGSHPGGHLTSGPPKREPKPLHGRGPPPPQFGGASGPQQKQFNSEEDEDEDDDDEEGSSGEDDEDEVHPPVEGAYDPNDYESLVVNPEIKELFHHITCYTPQSIELDHKLRPFIPDFIPAVGDIDAFIKIARPDGKPDTLGLTVLDEPCAKQSDPTVLDLQLRAISKQTTAKQLVVKSLENADRNPKHIENWVESIRELHRSKPPPNVHYSKNMPDIDTLMQEWPPEFEELLKEVGLPTAELDCDLGQYVEIVCSMLDIPIYRNSTHQNEKIQALHVLFTLYSEFKNSQHFRTLAEENRLDNSFKPDDNPDDQERLIL